MENKQDKINDLMFKLKELKFVWSWLIGKLHCGYCQKYKKHLTDYMYFNPYISCCRECYVQINKENK